MIDTEFVNRIKKLSDAELERQTSAAHVAAYYESHGNDDESRADALLEYRMLEQELERRKEPK
jgi:hypothetical protein